MLQKCVSTPKLYASLIDNLGERINKEARLTLNWRSTCWFFNVDDTAIVVEDQQYLLRFLGTCEIFSE